MIIRLQGGLETSYFWQAVGTAASEQVGTSKDFTVTIRPRTGADIEDMTDTPEDDEWTIRGYGQNIDILLPLTQLDPESWESVEKAAWHVADTIDQIVNPDDDDLLEDGDFSEE